MTQLALVERFVAFQGEGRNMGRPAIFVRFAGCNLDCVFADGSVCDTPWQKAREKVELQELMAWCAMALPVGRAAVQRERRPMLVVTGGEPTMAPAFDDLVAAACRAGYYVAVETNGTRWREGLRHAHWVAVSPKDQVAHGPRATADPVVDPRVWAMSPHEYRVVIGPDSPAPTWVPAQVHCLSPAMEADGSGTEWKSGPPRFVPGAVDRCLALIQADPRWRLSLQTHKWVGSR